MEETRLAEIATQYLLPLFSGAILDGSTKLKSGGKRVAFIDPCTIAFRVKPEDPYRLRMRRSQAFAKMNSTNVVEKDVVEAFAEVLETIAPGLNTGYENDLLSTFQRRVVAKATADSGTENIILRAIDQLALWATRLYEGKPVVASIGFTSDPSNATVTFHEISQLDFSSVLSNGFDTLLSFDFEGRLGGHFPLAQSGVAPAFAPYRQGLVAEWAKQGRVALVLNRLGEILVFKDQKLLFARRSGIWHFLTHEPVLTQMGYYEKAVRTAVYESCLDASFARTGACVGLLSSSKGAKWKELVPSLDDHLDAQNSVKTKAIAQMVGNKPARTCSICILHEKCWYSSSLDRDLV
jgi:hypothetical protein